MARHSKFREARVIYKALLRTVILSNMKTFSTRSLHALIPLLLVLAWVTIGAFGGPRFGKLSQLSTNDQASYLPANADSTKVQNLESQFLTSQKIPAIVLFESSRPLTPAAMQQLLKLNAKLDQVSGIASGPGSIVGPIPSQDHKAAEFLIQLASTSGVNTVIPALRTVVSTNTPTGTTGYVTGPAGIAADLFSAFKGIDGILLYVALIAVFVILLLVYRSIILPFLVLMTAGLALTGAGLLVYHGVNAGWFKLNSESQGILSILAIGAATDYSLLLIARYREALERYQSRWEAILHAVRNAIEPISASAATVVVGVLCLLFSDLNSNKNLGPIASFGIVFAYLAAITFLPALLLLFGRSAFWPFRPKHHPEFVERLLELKTGIEDRRGLWHTVPNFISKHARATSVITFTLLALAIFAVPQFKASGVSQTASILDKSNAVNGQQALERHFPAGSGSPVIIIANATKVSAVMSTIAHTANVSAVTPFTGTASPSVNPTLLRPLAVNNQVLVEATLGIPSDSLAAQNVIQGLRSKLQAVDPSALVGGTSAIRLDSNNASRSDLKKIIPIVLVVILLILMLLLRSIVAPLLLVGSVILSFGATIGISALMFNHVFHFPGSDPAIPLFGFIFLVALGVDYNIFLMTRVREETKKINTRPGILRGLSVTGGVITSAGIVLAATFAALSVIPILFLAQIAFIVAFGVLLDTTVVRSLLVPALCYTLGSRIWWPSKLWKRPHIKVLLHN